MGSQPPFPSRLIPVGLKLSSTSPNQPTQGNSKPRARGKPNSPHPPALALLPRQQSRCGGLALAPSPLAMPQVGWGELHQPVEEDTQAFGGREETAVEEVELVVIFHQELEPGFVAARGAHRLWGWEEERCGWEERGRNGEETLDLWSCTLASPGGRNSP